MNFKFFLSIFIQNILSFNTVAQEQINYIYPGENIITTELRYYIPFQQHLLESKETQLNAELIHEVLLEKQPFTFLSDNAKLFYFQNQTTEEDNMIMVLDNSNLYCLYIIKNYLLNEQLVSIPHFCNVTLPYQSCSKLFQLNTNIFISNCYLNKNQMVISIINFYGQVFDEMKFEIEQNCKIDFSYGYFYLLIYYQNCKLDNIYKIEIDEQIYQYKSFQKFDITLGINKTNTSFGQIEKINICDKDRIILIYQNLILYLNIKAISFTFLQLGANETILNVFSSCQGIQKILYIDYNNSQLRLDDEDLNMNSSQYINAIYFEKILVLHFNDFIVAKINDQLQQKIDIPISEILQIVESPYFFGLCKSELKLFQLQLPRNFYSFNTSQRIIYIILSKWNQQEKEFYLKQCQIEILNQSDPKIITNQDNMLIFQNDNDEICFEQSIISKSLPITVQAIKENEQYYPVNQIQNVKQYNLNFGEISKVLHYWKLNDLQNILLVQVQSKNLFILIVYQQDQVIQKYNIKMMSNYIDIFILLRLHILIFYEDHIQHVKINDPLSIQKKIIPLKNKIIKINKQFNQIFISHDKCIKSFLSCNSDDIFIFEEIDNYPLDCTQEQQISNTNLYIYPNKILNNSSRIKKYIQVGKIINVLENVEQSIFVLILDEGNQIVLKLFRLIKFDFIFMYKIPTYIFTFELSVIQKLENGYLMISARNQNKTFLLVYNLRNQAINSLIYITEIDSSQYFYEFIDLAMKTIVFIRDGKFFFHNLNQICLQYSFDLENKFFQKKQIEFVVNSFISNITSAGKIQIVRLNTNYQLMLMNQKIKYIDYEDHLDLDSIRGNIIKFEIQPIQDFIIKLPLNIMQEYFTCSYFESNLCLQNSTFIEIKSFNLSYNLPFYLYNLQIKGIVYNQESLSYQIFYVNQNFTFGQLILQLEKNEKDQFKIQKTEIVYKDLFQIEVSQIWKIKIIKDITMFFNLNLLGFLFYFNYCQIIDLFTINSIQYFLIDGAYLSNNTYIFLYSKQSFIQMSIIAYNNIQQTSEFQCKGDIIQDYQINTQDWFEPFYTSQLDNVLNSIEIIHLEMKGDLFIIKFILKYNILFTLVVEVSFNRIKYDNFKIQQYRFLRYEQNAAFVNLLYADNNVVVLTLLSDHQNFIYVYDIKGEMKYKDYLDSIQRIESFQYEKIEKLNITHYVIYDHKRDNISFVILNQFSLECQGQCNEPANLILSNDVSSISLQIQLKNVQYLNDVLTIKQGIILTNLIYIMIYIKFGKRARRKLNFQQNQSYL